jgi:hypothetical protein
MQAVPNRAQDETTEQPPPSEVVEAPRRPPIVTVFTRLARFSPRTKRWHKVPENEATSETSSKARSS